MTQASARRAGRGALAAHGASRQDLHSPPQCPHIRTCTRNLLRYAHKDNKATGVHTSSPTWARLAMRTAGMYSSAGSAPPCPGSLPATTPLELSTRTHHDAPARTPHQDTAGMQESLCQRHVAPCCTPKGGHARGSASRQSWLAGYLCARSRSRVQPAPWQPPARPAHAVAAEQHLQACAAQPPCQQSQPVETGGQPVQSATAWPHHQDNCVGRLPS